MLPRAAGTVTLNDKPLSDSAPDRVLKAGIALVPEQRELFLSLSVADNLRLGGYPRRGSAEIPAESEEPSLGLAPRIVEEIFGIIRRISAEGTAVLLIEQNAAIALDVASSGCVLDLGEVTLRGTSEELRNSPIVKASYL